MNNSIKLILAVIFILLFSVSEAQKPDSVNYSQTISGDFSFTKTWHYPPDIEKDIKTGQFSNQFTGEKVKPADTQHIYQSCNCECDFQGSHQITYCIANISNDTLILTFTNYDGSGYLKVKIFNGICSSQFYYTFVAPIKKNQPVNFQTTGQQLTLNTKSIKLGQKIRGKINVGFTMDYYLQNGTMEKRHFFLNGLFATKIKNSEK